MFVYNGLILIVLLSYMEPLTMYRSPTRVHAGTSKRLARDCIRWSFLNRLSLSTGAMYFMRIILNVPLSCKTRKLSIYSKFQTEDFTLFLQKLEYEIRFIIVKLKRNRWSSKTVWTLLMTVHQQMVHQCSPSFERYLFLAKSDESK